MKNDGIPQYSEHSDSPVLTEAADGAIRYILEGDPFDRPYELWGLPVFAIIAALRENDEELYGDDDTKLNDEQKERREEVEAEIDEAVENGMHYPHRGKRSSRKLAQSDYARLAGIKRDSVVNERRRNRNGATALRRELAKHRTVEPESLSGPVHTRGTEDN